MLKWGNMKIYLLATFFLLAASGFAGENSPKVVVVGAGFSGLTTAYRLHQEAFDTEVYEARNRVGGRVFSVLLNGHIAELGGQNIKDGGDAENILALVDELGLELITKKHAIKLHFFESDEFFDIRKLLKQKGLDKDEFLQQLENLQKDCNNMGEILQRLFHQDDLVYKSLKMHLSAYEGASPELLSTSYIRTLFHWIYGGLSSVHQGEWDEGFSSIELMTIKEGNGKLAEKLAERLGNRVHLNHVLKEIEKSEQGQYILTFENGKKVTADILVLTIPCPVYKDLSISEEVIPKETLAAIREIKNGTTAKISLPIKALKQSIGAHTNGKLVSFLNVDVHTLNLYYVDPYGEFSEETLFDTYNLAVPMISRLYEFSANDAPVMALDLQLASYQGPVGHSWITDRFARGSYSYIAAGQEDLFTATIRAGDEQVKKLFVPIDESLFFAGEHTTVHFDIIGTMEAAVESGEKAARMIKAKNS